MKSDSVHPQGIEIDLNRYKAALLDMDGVITNTARTHSEAWKQMFDEFLQQWSEKQGCEFEPFNREKDYYRYVDGKPRYEGAQSFLESRGISLPYGSPDDPPDRETICGLGNRKNRFFLEWLKKRGAESYQSTVRLVRQMKKRNLRVAAISSSRSAEAVLRSAGVRDLFDEVVDGVYAAQHNLRGKPEPDIFLEAAGLFGVGPEEAMVIEDAIAGVAAGRAGGFALVIGIDRSGGNRELNKHGADIVVSDLSEIRVEREEGVQSGQLPSVFEKKDEILEILKQRRPAIFLDYDGTLTPIVEDPAQAYLPDHTRQLMRQLSEHWTVAVMSGRALYDVRSLVGLENLVYAGSHGFNMAGAMDSFHETPGKPFRPPLDRAEADLKADISDLKGVRCERKPFAIAVHYRQADETIVPELEKRVDAVAGRHPDLVKTTGKKIFELRPGVNWNKGKALLFLLEKLHIDSTHMVPLYIGDDVTDEDAFRAISKSGIGILVSDRDIPTAAGYTLRDPAEVAVFLEELVKLAEKESSRNVWALAYERYEPEAEKHREALCTVGNGYFATRGAAPESTAGNFHYPGTYIAGVYNRLISSIDGHRIENESMVNAPNWLRLSFCIEDEDWFSLESVDILEYRQELDMARGILIRSVRFEDGKKRRTSLNQRRFVHMSNPHLAGLETTLMPENWSGTIRVRSALDGRVENTLVERYRQLNNHHLRPVGSGAEGHLIWLQVETNQSFIRIAEAARTEVFYEGLRIKPARLLIQEPGYISQDIEIKGVQAGRIVRIDKVVSLFTSRDSAVSESLIEACAALRHSGTFAELLDRHVLAWAHLWERWKIRVESQSPRIEQILNLHVFHLLETVSPDTVDLDTGVPPRGLHGEAYRGLIMWDELFIFPLLNLRIPDITRSLLKYRYRRLLRACWAAKHAGFRGAMFPWQSGSNGQERAQTLHLNPVSGRWIPDNSQLERHINVAIAYNIWQYYQVTGDQDFLSFYGAEMLIGIARFWAGKAQYNKSIDRYEICKVMGPDEFHDRYPDSSTPGIDNNAYTNVMVAWALCRTLDMLNALSAIRRQFTMEDLAVRKEEPELWDEISRKLRVPFHDYGIISQFEGYGQLREFEWETYRRKYKNIQRLDRILEAEGDSTNRYKLSKQADVLMLFYLLSADEIGELFRRLNYPFNSDTIPKNIEYYMKRTSHGSTLSRIVHAWVLSRSRREVSWRLFHDALESDIEDIQGGTTREGIHLGAMAGTVDLVLRCYSGVESRGDVLWFNPKLPSELKSLKFSISYRNHWIDVAIDTGRIVLHSRPSIMPAVRIGVHGKVISLASGETKEFAL